MNINENSGYFRAEKYIDTDSERLKRLQQTITATLYFFMLNVVTSGGSRPVL